MLKTLFILNLFISAELVDNSESKELWNYANIRPDAYVFWWLYYTDISSDYANYPLIVWLQGGLGSSGTGFGNFIEIGPLDINLQSRNETWLKKANLLFIDSPVGTGYSYVTNNSAFATTNKEIARDLVKTLCFIFKEAPEFEKSPLYIFGESYGGKIAPDFTLQLIKAIRRRKISCNFKGIALGNPLISPCDSASSVGQFLRAMSFLDDNEMDNLKSYPTEIEKSLSHKKYNQATNQYFQFQKAIKNYTNNADFNNILRNTGPSADESSSEQCYFEIPVSSLGYPKLSALMNGVIREKLGIIPENVSWTSPSEDVLTALFEDYMKPVIASVDRILRNQRHIAVNVYNAQLDPIVNNIGTLQWVEKLKWSGINGFRDAHKTPFTFNDNRTAGFIKSFEQFSFYWIIKSGSIVPVDAPKTSLELLDMIISKKR